MDWQNYNKDVYWDLVSILQQWPNYNPREIWNSDEETWDSNDIFLVRTLLDIIHDKDEKIKQEQYLNKNLKRICKDRANKDRNIDKKSSGYVLLSERSRKLKNIKDRKGNCRTFYLISMQTPCNSEFYESDVIIQFQERFTRAFIFSEKSSFEIKAADINDDGFKFFTFNYEYNLNYNTGYWEVTFLCNRRLRCKERYV